MSIANGVGNSVIFDTTTLLGAGGAGTENFLLLETGDFFLLEDDCKLILETIFVVDESGNNIVDENNNFITA